MNETLLPGKCFLFQSHNRLQLVAVLPRPPSASPRLVKTLRNASLLCVPQSQALFFLSVSLPASWETPSPSVRSSQSSFYGKGIQRNCVWRTEFNYGLGLLFIPRPPSLIPARGQRRRSGGQGGGIYKHKHAKAGKYILQTVVRPDTF